MHTTPYSTVTPVVAPDRLTPTQGQDPRWQALTHVRTARHILGLKDRDLAVLRGLLSLLPAAQWGGEMVVFGANRTLADRCDGIEERTLRRRLARLAEVGLITRRFSPNGKRYAIRDTQGDILLAYGIDLSPLAAMAQQLADMAASAAAEAKALQVTKALIRDRLFHLQAAGCTIDPVLAETARLSLRRNLDLATLEELLTCLTTAWDNHAEATADTHETSDLSASDSRNDRHILNHNQDNYDLTLTEESDTGEDISLAACLTEAPSAAAMALEKPRSWPDVVKLATSLAPALGVKAQQWQAAQSCMGAMKAALAILGLVEAIDRIKSPQAYLARLIGQAQNGTLDAIRMFRSLTRVKTARI